MIDNLSSSATYYNAQHVQQQLHEASHCLGFAIHEIHHTHTYIHQISKICEYLCARNEAYKVCYEQLQAPRVELDGRVALAVITRRGTHALCSSAVVVAVAVVVVMVGGLWWLWLWLRWE